MNFKKLILTFLPIQMLLSISSTPIFAQDCDHWLKIVQIDKSVGGLFKIMDDNGTELQTIVIPTGTDVVAAGRIIERSISAHKVLKCFTRVGPYLRVNNIRNYKILDIGSLVGYKLVEVNRPNFISKVDTATISAYRKKHHVMKGFNINSETEMYDGYILEPIAYEPKVPPFGQPTEKITNWWNYKLTFFENDLRCTSGVYVDCSINEYNVDHYITIKVGIKKLALKE